MVELRVLIPAAGRGSRAGLPYPKTLYPVDGIPILHRLLSVLSIYDANPTVVVSPEGEPLIRDSLHQAGLNAHLVIQPEPLGMGDAVLCFDQSPVAKEAEHILLVWGDLVDLQAKTVSKLVDKHIDHDNDFTFATRSVDHAYTLVKRNEHGHVIAVYETREQKLSAPEPGEREIGLFVFRKHIVFRTLVTDHPAKIGFTTGEHGFLYAIELLANMGARVEALPIATQSDLISFNSFSDIK